MAHRTPAAKAKDHAYHALPYVKKRRAANTAARRQLEREGVVHKGDGKDVAHKKALDAGGTNARSNLTVQPPSVNRGWRKGKTGYNP